MTIDQYIQNPLSAGKPSAVMNSIIREGMKTTYNNKFDNILMRENGDIKYYLYKNTKANEYFIHIKIPSEVVKKFYYDVVFKFFTDASAPDAGRSLNKYQMQFFSNDPAYVYTYAYVFASNDMVVKELNSKLGRDPLKKSPDIKNPDKSTGYIKSLYFAYIYMQRRGLFNITNFSGAQEFSKNLLLKNIEDADSKISKREEEGKKVSKKKEILVSKKIADDLSHNKILASTDALQNVITTTNKVKAIKRTSASNSTKNIRRTKKI